MMPMTLRYVALIAMVVITALSLLLFTGCTRYAVTTQEVVIPVRCNIDIEPIELRVDENSSISSEIIRLQKSYIELWKIVKECGTQK